MKLLLLASFTFQEALRKKALYASTALTLVFLALYAVGIHYSFQDIDNNTRLPVIVRQAVKGEMLLAGLYVIANVGALLAIFMAAGAISNEIDSGTIHSIVPKPVGRWEIVMGKWLGYALMLTAYVGITSATAIAIVYALGGQLPDNTLGGLALMVLKSLLLLSVAMLGSTLLSAIAAGIIAFILYALSNVAGMIEQMGVLIQNQTMINIGIITSLVIPSDVLWKLAAHLVLPAIDFAAIGLPSIGGPFTTLNPPSVWMVVYSVAYIAALMIAAMVVFQKRDL